MGDVESAPLDDVESAPQGDVENTPLRAFLNGLLKGMAAPLKIYHRENMEPLPEFKRVFKKQPSDAEALANDWKTVGEDLRIAMFDYGQRQTG